MAFEGKKSYFFYSLKSGLLVLGILFVLNIFSWSRVLDLSRPSLLEVVFLNVGQGDAIFIETPARQQILIDGGPDSAVLEKLALKMPFGDRTIDLIVLSHPEKDHLTGLLDVLKRYKVDNILWTGIVRDTPEYKEWAELIIEEGARVKTAIAGQKIILSEGENFIYFDVLNPDKDLSGRFLRESNDSSIVVRLAFNDIGFLFTGDISEVIERKLASAGPAIESEVLKVSHHGSKYSTSSYFLEKVSPAIAVIETGSNPYGHPTGEALERLKNFGINILRTDINGDIRIISDGKNYDSYFAGP